MPYAPGVQFDSRPLYEGLASAGRSIAAGREAEWQRQFLAQQLQQQQTYGWGMRADEDAKDYYSLGLQNDGRTAALAEEKRYHDAELSNRARALDLTEKDNAPYTPPPEVVAAAAKAGYLYAPQSKKGGSWIPRKDNSAEPPAPGSDPTGTGDYFWNGRQLMRIKPAAGVKMSPLEEIALRTLDGQIAAKEKEMAGLAGQPPDQNTGLLGLWGPTVADKQQQHALDLQELQAKRDALLGRIKMGGGATAPNPATSGDILPSTNFQPATKPSGGFYGPAPTPPPTSYGGYTNPPPTRTAPVGRPVQTPFTPPPLPTGAVLTPAPGLGAPLPDALPNLDATATALVQARIAIANGEPVAAVKQRLAAAGIDPSGL